MDRTISGAELARELNTSLPRVVRAADQLGIERAAGGRLALTPAQVENLRGALGFVPEIDGLTRSEAMVLAALRQAPLGLVSARAVARRSTLSPTAAGKALWALLDQGLVTCREEVVAAGTARKMTVWRANVAHPRWRDLSRQLDTVELPGRGPTSDRARGGGDARVPGHLLHLFWNTAREQLDVDSSGPYIARRLLRTMDLQGLAWGAATLRAEDWRAGAAARGLEPEVRQLAQNLEAAAIAEARAGEAAG
jgi:hypothetical protein